MTRRADRSDQDKWVLFYSLLAELQPSPAAKRARALIFGRNAIAEEKPEATPEIKLRATRNFLLLSSYRIGHPGADAAIYRHKDVKVDRRDWHRWKNGELPDSSRISSRIKEFLIFEDSPTLT